MFGISTSLAVTTILHSCILFYTVILLIYNFSAWIWVQGERRCSQREFWLLQDCQDDHGEKLCSCHHLQFLQEGVWGLCIADVEAGLQYCRRETAGEWGVPECHCSPLRRRPWASTGGVSAATTQERHWYSSWRWVVCLASGLFLGDQGYLCFIIVVVVIVNFF